jgi:hypothetical protein
MFIFFSKLTSNVLDVEVKKRKRLNEEINFFSSFFLRIFILLEQTIIFNEAKNLN